MDGDLSDIGEDSYSTNESLFSVPRELRSDSATIGQEYQILDETIQNGNYVTSNCLHGNPCECRRFFYSPPSFFYPTTYKFLRFNFFRE